LATRLNRRHYLFHDCRCPVLIDQARARDSFDDVIGVEKTAKLRLTDTPRSLVKNYTINLPLFEAAG
jgi:hypothetical protein